MLYSNCTIYSNTLCFRRNHILYGMIVSNIQLLMGVYDSGKKFANFKRNIAVFSEKTDVPHLPKPLSMVAISVMKLWTWKLGQGHQNQISYIGLQIW